MITGVVRSQQCWVPLRVRGTRGTRKIEAVIDTGFNGALMLPASLIHSLRLPWQTSVRGTLADGSQCVFAVYEATLIWDRRARQVAVVESESDALVGMELLDGFELKVQVRTGGRISIRRLKE